MLQSSQTHLRFVAPFRSPLPRTLPSSVMDKLLTRYNSEFPSLSNNAQLGNAGQSNLWASGGRNAAAPIPRNQGTPISSQQSQQQDDLFSTSSRLSSAQGSFRFGNPPSATQGSQSQATSVDEFPPLNRNANGEIGQERGANLMSGFAFGSAAGAPAPAVQANRTGNGLLNALSANSRATELTTGVLSHVSIFSIDVHIANPASRFTVARSQKLCGR